MADPLPRATSQADLVRLQELRSRFDHTAFEHPDLDAVVVYRPDLRREEADRQARNLHVKPVDPASENFNAVDKTGCHKECMQHVRS